MLTSPNEIAPFHILRMVCRYPFCPCPLAAVTPGSGCPAGHYSPQTRLRGGGDEAIRAGGRVLPVPAGRAVAAMIESAVDVWVGAATRGRMSAYRTSRSPLPADMRRTWLPPISSDTGGWGPRLATEGDHR